MAKITLTDITGSYLSSTVFNNNNTLIEAAIENTLSRNGTAPNAMGAELDMNSNYINNLPDAVQNQQPATYAQLVAASGSLSTVPASLVTITDAGGLYTSDNVEGALQEVTFQYAQSALETTNGITPTDTTYVWGDVRRYGAVADSSAGVGGTDNTTAFQNAVDSGHEVYIPEGHWAIEGTVEVFSLGGQLGGPTVRATGKTRIEKFTNANQNPIFHFSGALVHFDGGGCTIAAREYGGYTKGLVLVGADPTAVDENDDSVLDTNYMVLANFRVLGNTTTGVTGTDGSVGVYLESPARRRGGFVTPSTINVFYNTFQNIFSTQWDYCWFLSTDANANFFSGCSALTFGTSGFWCNGYGNQFVGCKVESGITWDSRERASWTFGNKDEGPEGTFGAAYECDADCTTVAISNITKGATTAVTCGAVHGLSTGNYVRLKAIVDNGPDGDLETALNGGSFQVTVTSTTAFTIPLDTSALTNTYASGGNVHISPYGILGAFRNNVFSYTENAFNASTRVIRGFLVSRPTGAYDSEKTFEAVFGTNNINLSGTLSGGVGPSGRSDEAYVLNNTVWTPAVNACFGTITKLADWEVRPLDDRTGTSFGNNECKRWSGRLTDLGESTAYTVFSWDEVGPSGACGLLTLRFAGKVSGSATQRNHVGEIKWALFFETGTESATQLMRLESDNNNGHPGEWSLTTSDATSGSSYGKYNVVFTTNSLTGTNNEFYYAWDIELLVSQLEESNLDWDADISVLDGSQGDYP